MNAAPNVRTGRRPVRQRQASARRTPARVAIAMLVFGLAFADDPATAEGISGTVSPLIRPFLLTRDGDTWPPPPSPAAQPPEGLERLPTISDRVDALLMPISVMQPMPHGPDAARGVATHRRASGPNGRLDELPVLLRPFYSTATGQPLEAAADSPVVSSARWFSDTWRGTRRSWGPSLWRPLWVPGTVPVERSGVEAELVAFDQSESRPLPEAIDGAAQQLPPPTDGQPSPPREDAKTDRLGGDEELGSPPEDETLQFLRTATVLLEPGQLQMDFGVIYSLAENDLPLFLAPDVVAEYRIRQRQLIVPLEFRYGLVRNTQVFVSVPLGWANAELAMEGLEAFENTGGIGDVRSGATVLLKQGTDDCPDVTATFSFTAPTGSATILTVPSPLAPANMGDGFWALSADLLMIHNIDPVVFFYGVGTRQRFERTFEGVVFQPGGEYSYLFGAGFAVNEKVTLSSTFAGAYVSELHLDDARVPGTIQEPMSLRFAATIARRKLLVEPFVEFGLTDDATSARFGIVWTH